MDTRTLASCIDHTILKPDATPSDVERVCEEAIQHCFASVCVNSCYVNLVERKLRGSGVAACSVVGFPLGAMSTMAKMQEARSAICNGATELDIVMNVGFFKGGDRMLAQVDLYLACREAQSAGAKTKVIIETALLSPDEIRRASLLALDVGADFVKTSTGFSSRGASVDDVLLMRATVGERAKVKASGGIRDLVTMEAMLSAGADRIGTSNGVAIMKEAIQKYGNP